jgi:hypothetical protein
MANGAKLRRDRHMSIHADSARHWGPVATIVRQSPPSKEPFMKYAILVYETPAELAAREDPERTVAYWSAYTAYSNALRDAGVAAGGAGLQVPALATTVRLREGKRFVQDGPFADTKELLGGLFIIDVPDLSVALAWAERCPASSTGSVEVRPMLPPPPGV